MVVDVIKKETESIIFEGDYYRFSVATMALQKYYYKIKDATPDTVKLYIKNWVKDRMKIDANKTDGITNDEDLKEIFMNSLNELTNAVEKFMEEYVSQWDIIEPDNMVKVQKSYVYRSEVDENEVVL